MTRYHLAFATIALAGVLAAHAVQGDPQPKAPQNAPSATGDTVDADRWMLTKARLSQDIFDGLIHADFDKVESRARRMLMMNILEQWATTEKFTRMSDYEGQLNAFEFSVKELVRQGQDKNIDGALDAYVQMSRSCVQCHKLIRDAAAAK